jgi:hypothetical protein
MKTGTDVSISECRASGYPVVEHTGKFNPDKSYPLTISFPPHWTDGGKPMVGVPRSELYATDGLYSYRELWEIFESKGDGIKEFCDFKSCPHPPPDEANFYDLASLAGTIDKYCGLD